MDPKQMQEPPQLSAPSPRSRSTNCHLSARRNSEYFRSLSSLALEQTAPSTLAAPGCAVPSNAIHLPMHNSLGRRKWRGRTGVALANWALTNFFKKAILYTWSCAPIPSINKIVVLHSMTALIA